MHRFRKILVPIDGDPARQPVLARAARLAGRSGAAIRLIAVVADIPWYTALAFPDAEALQAARVRQKSDALEGLAAPLRRDGLEIATEVLRGRPSIEMVREVLRGGHDLLMKEAGPNQGVLFGSTDMHLLRNCPCPLWLFRPGHEGPSFARVLAAVDPAPPPDEADLLHLKEESDPGGEALDRKVLELAGSLAEEDGAELHVVHAWSAPGEQLARGNLMLSQDQIDRYVEDSRAEARKALDRLLGSVAGPPGRVIHLSKGDPADVIAGLAKSGDTDLIVMGTVGRAGIPGLLIGNTAETILQRVDCSVLAVKPDGFVSPVAPDS